MGSVANFLSIDEVDSISAFNQLSILDVQGSPFR